MEAERSHPSGDERLGKWLLQSQRLDLESPRRPTSACAFAGLGLLFELLVLSPLREYRSYCACSGAHSSHI